MIDWKLNKLQKDKFECSEEFFFFAGKKIESKSHVLSDKTQESRKKIATAYCNNRIWKSSFFSNKKLDSYKFFFLSFFYKCMHILYDLRESETRWKNVKMREREKEGGTHSWDTFDNRNINANTNKNKSHFQSNKFRFDIIFC